MMRAEVGGGNGWLDKNGYRLIRVDGVDVPEHRAIMERTIGRKLFAHETVHHKNGQRTDNRPENLELWSSRHGSGQRVSDKIQFCEDFLREYGIAISRPTFSETIFGIA